MVASFSQILPRRDRLLGLQGYRAGLEPAADVQYAAHNAKFDLVLSGTTSMGLSLEALTMPALLATAAPAVPGFEATLVPGEDDVLYRQTQFEVAGTRRNLGRTPGFTIPRSLQAYHAAMLAGEAAA